MDFYFRLLYINTNPIDTTGCFQVFRGKGSPVVCASWVLLSWSPDPRGTSRRQYLLGRAEFITWSQRAFPKAIPAWLGRIYHLVAEGLPPGKTCLAEQIYRLAPEEPDIWQMPTGSSICDGHAINLDSCVALLTKKWIHVKSDFVGSWTNTSPTFCKTCCAVWFLFLCLMAYQHFIGIYLFAHSSNTTLFYLTHR